MCAEEMKIFLKENAVPYRVSAPRPIPEPANSEIARHIKSRIIIPCDGDYRLLLSDVDNSTHHSAYSFSLKSDLDSLSSSDGLVLLDSRRIVLPVGAIKPILHLLHNSHSGMNKTITLARGLYYWPGMINNIKQLISSCNVCVRVQPSQPFNPMVTPPPSSHLGYPTQHVGLDLFTYGNKQHLICVDHWSVLDNEVH